MSSATRHRRAPPTILSFLPSARHVVTKPSVSLASVLTSAHTAVATKQPSALAPALGCLQDVVNNNCEGKNIPRWDY